MQDEQNSTGLDLTSLKELNAFMGERVSDINDLTRAVKEGRIEAVRELLDLGIHIDEVDNHNFTPLQMAAKCGHYEIVELLLNEGADINKVEECSDKIYELAKSSPNPDEFNHQKLDPLQLAVKCNHIRVVELLFDHFKEGEFRDDPSRVLLIKALGNPEMVNTLLDTAARLKLDLWTDCTLLEYIDEGFIEGVRCLLDRGVDPAADEGSYYMHNAVGNIPMMKLLLSYGGPDLLNEIDGDDYNLLEHAIRKNELQTAKWLISQKTFQINENYNPVHQILHPDNKNSVDQKLNMLKYFDEYGLSFGKVDEKGFKPIHYAAMYCSPAILKYFVEKEFDINDATAPQGDSLLHLAMQKDNLGVIDYLISKGANIHITNNKEQTPLEVVCDNDNLTYTEHGAVMLVSNKQALKAAAKLIIAGAGFVKRLYDDKTEQILEVCSLAEGFVVLLNLYYEATCTYFGNLEYSGATRMHQLIEKKRSEIIEYLNKKAWDRRPQIKVCDQMIELLPKAKLFELMTQEEMQLIDGMNVDLSQLDLVSYRAIAKSEAIKMLRPIIEDSKKLLHDVKNRKKVLEGNDRNVLGICFGSLSKKLISGEVKFIENIREGLSEDEEIKNFYDACMFNKSSLKDAEKKKKELVKLGPIRKATEEAELANKVLKSSIINSAVKKIREVVAAEKIAIYQEENDLNPNAFNELFAIGTIQDGEKEIG